MKGRIGIALAAAVLAVGCGKKGDTGAAGTAGPTGPIGALSLAPRIDGAYPPIYTAHSTMVLTGANFAAPAASNHVFVDGWEATVVAGDATDLVVTTAAQHDLSLVYGQAATHVTVVSGNQTSNAFELIQVSPGVALGLGTPNVNGSVRKITVAASGDLIVTYSDHANRVTPAGVVSTETYFAEGNVQKSWVRADGDWYVTNSGRLYHGAAIVADFNVSVADAEFDANGDFFVVSAPSQSLVSWNHTTHAFTSTDLAGGVLNDQPRSITRIGATLYVGARRNSTGAFVIFSVPIAAPATFTAIATGLFSLNDLTNDGTALISYSDPANTGSRFVSYDATTGAPTDLALLTVASTPTAIVVDGAGKVFLGAGREVFRVTNATTLDAWVGPIYLAYSSLGDRNFIGSDEVCGGTPSQTGDVLYEAKMDGTLARVSGALCTNGDSLPVVGGAFVQRNFLNGNFEKISVTTGLATLYFDNVTTPQLGSPNRMVSDAAGNLYISHFDLVTDENEIAKLTPAGVLTPDFVTLPNPGAIINGFGVQGARLVLSVNGFPEALDEAPLAAASVATLINDAFGESIGYFAPMADGSLLFMDLNTGNLRALHADNTVDDVAHMGGLNLNTNVFSVDQYGNIFGVQNGSYVLVLL